jgi:hypothetical protein
MAQAAHNLAIHFDRYPRRDPIYAAIHLHEKARMVKITIGL